MRGDRLTALIELSQLPTIGGYEWLIIFLIILILFGAKKLPELARGLGEAVKEFKRASSEEPKREVRPVRRSEEALGEDKVVQAAKALGLTVEGKSREELLNEVLRKLKEGG